MYLIIKKIKNYYSKQQASNKGKDSVSTQGPQDKSNDDEEDEEDDADGEAGTGYEEAKGALEVDGGDGKQEHDYADQSVMHEEDEEDDEPGESVPLPISKETESDRKDNLNFTPEASPSTFTSIASSLLLSSIPWTYRPPPGVSLAQWSDFWKNLSLPTDSFTAFTSALRSRRKAVAQQCGYTPLQWSGFVKRSNSQPEGMVSYIIIDISLLCILCGRFLLILYHDYVYVCVYIYVINYYRYRPLSYWLLYEP